MKLNEFKVQAPRGTFYAARPSALTREAILDFIADNRIPNPIKADQLHCTVCYSRIWTTERALGDLNPIWKGAFERYNVWPSDPNDPDPVYALTLSFSCPEMVERHLFLRKQGASHDYPEFLPHLTLSYTIDPDYDHNQLQTYQGPLEFDHEYCEPLKLNWREENT